MKITRVILVGNSLKQPEMKEDAVKKPASPLTRSHPPVYLPERDNGIDIQVSE